jgi:hypothetical protein
MNDAESGTCQHRNRQFRNHRKVQRYAITVSAKPDSHRPYIIATTPPVIDLFPAYRAKAPALGLCLRDRESLAKNFASGNKSR